jgi:hypothetical protein
MGIKKYPGAPYHHREIKNSPVMRKKTEQKSAIGLIFPSHTSRKEVLLDG